MKICNINEKKIKLVFVVNTSANTYNDTNAYDM